jgi:hypothetical protein
MRKSRKDFRTTAPAEATHRLYARAYGSRLAKQVGEELETSRRSQTPRKKPAKR